MDNQMETEYADQALAGEITEVGGLNQEVWHG